MATHINHVPEKGAANGLATLDGSGLVPYTQLPPIPFMIECGRNANATNIWLRGPDGTPHNEAPIRIPFNATLVAISVTTNGAETWDAEVYKNTDVRGGGTPTDGNKIAELVVTASQSDSSSAYSVNVSTGDEIGVFCRGTTIDRPHVCLFFIRRA